METPQFVQIEPVGQCNLRCQMCPIQFRKDGPPHGPVAFMDYSLFTHIIDQFPGLKELHLLGLGEPLMHPRFFEMVAYAAQKGAQVSVNTNVTLLSQKKAEACVKSDLRIMHVSLDGATAQTYERIRVRSSWERVLRNLDRFARLKEEVGGKGPSLHIVMVLMKQNLDELPDLIRLCGRWPVDRLWVQHLCHDYGETDLPEHYKPMRDYVDEQNLMDEDPLLIAAVYARARAMAAEVGINLRLPLLRKKEYAADVPGEKRCD